MLALCVPQFVFRGEEWGFGSHGGEGLSEEPKEANPGDLAAVPPLWTFLGTWSHCGGLNIFGVLILYLHSQYKTLNTHYLVRAHQSPWSRRQQKNEAFSFSVVHQRQHTLKCHWIWSSVVLILKQTKLSWNVESPFGKRSRGRAERTRQVRMLLWAGEGLSPGKVPQRQSGQRILCSNPSMPFG